jgi:hypothetical protein
LFENYSGFNEKYNENHYFRDSTLGLITDFTVVGLKNSVVVVGLLIVFLMQAKFQNLIFKDEGNIRQIIELEFV